ncbi:hypothetical protein DDB_G0288665 [Dictyostelium discoideum AX4]|uniref:DNA-directed RNA polymerase III subunit n=1 Tax=Dictyostelium discoideum TaxID=44689 RepID=Q54IM0_DICDI|nr:hypothetical protein DDB_G0288665 [Dictyostelium discoideum AX4]EAL63109.1 hypothetical protein DDB_G0288665 [Dictyostelium discoideum AX4]|eukprot:XP_636611.1 hypothetical protein DDB_G0288665 [Dictyostelium discoideum AX4]
MYRGPSNGGLSSLGKRDRDNDDDEDGEKKDKLSFDIPKPIYPPRKDMPSIPIIDSANYRMIEYVIKLKESIPFSIYNLSRDSIKPKDGIERYSNRFEKNDDTGSTFEIGLVGIKYGYFPYELVVNKKKTKKKLNMSNKTIEELQKLEKEGGEGEGEGEENEEEEPEEEDEGDYDDGGGVDDDSDMGGDSDGDGEATY